MTTVYLDNLVKRYQHVEAARVSLEVGDGELVALLGPSGCGKTTILKMIAGLLSPSEGDVRFDGRSVTHIPTHRRGVAMVFQKPLLFPYMTIGDNVAFGLRMRGVPRNDRMRRVREILELVRLPGMESRWPRQLSGGQEQRISLARALIVEPKVLLLDEPLSQLDANLRIEMRDLIVRVQRESGITTIFVTHDQEEAVAMADRIALIFGGRLQQYDRPRGFYERPKDARVARFFGGVNFIPATKNRTRVDSDLGTFVIPDAAGLADGPVSLTIRPEMVELGDERRTGNGFSGVVRSTVYMGTYVRYVVQVGAVDIRATTDLRKQYRQGDRVSVNLPHDQMWVVPKEDSSDG
jgi:ABC-type Fe3+/spermidine/putrescine transport system ATPase subunit